MAAMFEMLIGIPGSGKLTYAKKKIDEGCIVVSSDALRKELYGAVDE